MECNESRYNEAGMKHKVLLSFYKFSITGFLWIYSKYGQIIKEFLMENERQSIPSQINDVLKIFNGIKPITKI